ncbi:hypothetical protein LS684_10490 [Cytobacillus spongiae]|jgi:hypothetical protein|uniref:hypothetical protein n=1 Tax=Cytobacillus spongiae TaxID=2901381 RepID=UPI001F410B1F|nr:hypothetical protein [Cytobacillus spongiae]UII54135.1 hypothetical protein LS684_10490 [Cytobacillus spongiae]
MENYIYLTEVGKEPQAEFYVELYGYNSNLTCESHPIKTIYCFEQLIQFVEELND